jgi:hypothetical protein
MFLIALLFTFYLFDWSSFFLFFLFLFAFVHLTSIVIAVSIVGSDLFHLFYPMVKTEVRKRIESKVDCVNFSERRGNVIQLSWLNRSVLELKLNGSTHDPYIHLITPYRARPLKSDSQTTR